MFLVVLKEVFLIYKQKHISCAYVNKDLEENIVRRNKCFAGKKCSRIEKSFSTKMVISNNDFGSKNNLQKRFSLSKYSRSVVKAKTDFVCSTSKMVLKKR